MATSRRSTPRATRCNCCTGLKAKFVLATVQEPVYLYEMVLPPGAEVLERVTGAVGGKALAGAEALFNAAGVPYEREIASGEPAPVLIDMARRHGCDAIIMGARGRGALRSSDRCRSASCRKPRCR